MGGSVYSEMGGSVWGEIIIYERIYLPIHADQKLRVVAGAFHPVEQEFHGFLGVHGIHQF